MADYCKACFGRGAAVEDNVYKTCSSCEGTGLPVHIGPVDLRPGRPAWDCRHCAGAGSYVWPPTMTTHRCDCFNYDKMIADREALIGRAEQKAGRKGVAEIRHRIKNATHDALRIELLFS